MKTVLLALAFALPVLAQAQNPDATFTESHLASAAEMLEASGARETMEATMEATLDAQLSQAPQMAQFEDIMRAFFEKYMSWDNLADEMIRLQAGAYTEGELRELTAFYRTPLGQKVRAVSPQLAAQGAAVGQRVTAEHMPELQAAIMERAQQLQNAPAEEAPDVTGN